MCLELCLGFIEDCIGVVFGLCLGLYLVFNLGLCWDCVCGCVLRLCLGCV